MTYDDRAAQAAATLPLLDPAFPAVRAVVCYAGAIGESSADELKPVAVEVRADDVPALVALLRKPDEVASSTVDHGGLRDVCTMQSTYIPWAA